MKFGRDQPMIINRQFNKLDMLRHEIRAIKRIHLMQHIIHSRVDYHARSNGS